MKGIQILSSRPIIAGRNASGLFNNQSKKVSLSETSLLYTKASALQWRRTNSPVTLYTDLPMKNYLEKLGILNYWDDVDTDVLETFYIENPDINYTAFWSAPKFACYLANTAPFICLDTDLIVWKYLKFDRNLDFAFAHYETVERGDISYPPLSKINTPKDFKILKHSNEKFRHFALNMSLCYFGNEKFKQEFAEKALEFMRRNNVEAKERYAVPELLYAEQRLPLAILLKRKLKFAPIIDAVWSPKQFRLIQSEFNHNWFFSDLNYGNAPWTHVWFHKKYLAQNIEANTEYCEKLREKIADGLD